MYSLYSEGHCTLIERVVPMDTLCMRTHWQFDMPPSSRHLLIRTAPFVHGPFIGSGTQGSKISPFSALGATTATTADDGDRPGVNVLTEPSIACGGVSAAEQDSKDVGSGGDGPPGAEDSFDLTPSPARPSAAQSVKSLQQPFKAVQQQQQQQQQDQQQPAFRKPPTLLTETYSLDMDGTGSRPGTAVPPPGASETPRQGRIDVGECVCPHLLWSCGCAL